MTGSRPTIHHLGRAGDVPGGMTQVINGYLDWSFPNVDVAVITTRGDPHDTVAGVTAALRGFVRILRLPRSGTVVVGHLSERGSFVREGALLRLARLRGIATVAHLHGASFAEFTERFPGLVRFALRSADRVIALSDESVTISARFVPKSNVVLIPNAIPGSTPRPKLDLIVFGGVVSHRKGVDVLMAAWRRIADHRGWRLVVAGPIRDEDVVDRTVPDVDFLGAQPHADLMALLDSSRVAVLPSREEAMPMFILEAMARANCVIATTVGGIPPVLADGRGVLVAPNDPDSLRAALDDAISDSDAREHVAATAIRAFERSYSATAVFPQVESVWMAAMTHAEARRTTRWRSSASV